MSSGLRGTDATQDSRFKDKEALSIKSTKFPKCFDTKVDLRKVNIGVLRPWIAKKVTEMIKFEDDVVVEYVFGMLEDKDSPMPDPRKMQVNLLGFMDKYGAAHFTETLWNLLVSAQNTVGGVPAEFIEAKKKEIQMQQALGQDPGQNPETGNLPPRPQGRDRPRDEKPFLPPPGSGARERDRPPRGDQRSGRGGRGREQGWQPPRMQDGGYGARGGDSGRGGDQAGRGGYGGRRDDQDRGGNGYRGERGGPPGQSEGHSQGQGWQPRRRDDGPPPPRRSRSRSPGRRERDRPPPPSRRRSPSPAARRRDESPPPRRRDDSRPRRESPPRRRRDEGTPPRRTRDDTPPARKRRDSTPPRGKADDDTPPRRRRDDTPPRRARGRDQSRSRSRSRSATVTPPPRRRRRSPSRSRSRTRSPPPKVRRRRSTTPPVSRVDAAEDEMDQANRNGGNVQEPEVVRKGRGFEKEKKTKELEAPLKASKWGAMDDDE